MFHCAICTGGQLIEPLPRSNVEILSNQRREAALPLTLARLTDEFLQLADLLTEVDPSDTDGLAAIHEQLMLYVN
jgi:hypothetical protein